MSRSVVIGYGFISRYEYYYSEIKENVIEEEGEYSIKKTPYDGLYIIHDNINETGRYVFGNITLLDECCYSLETFKAEALTEEKLNKLRKDFLSFIESNTDFNDEFLNPDKWEESFYIQLGED